MRRPSGLQRGVFAAKYEPAEIATVHDQFRKEARRRGVGYQTLINEVLARQVRKDVA